MYTKLSLRAEPVTPVAAELTWFYGWSKWKAKGGTLKFWEDVTGES